MQGNDKPAGSCTGLKGFMQTRFFYGQRLDVRHFESEQNYVKGKLWMLNRLIHGFGVVCGMDVVLGDDRASVVVQPGLALDRAGREIVIPGPTVKQPIPQMEPQQPTDKAPNGEQPKQGECCDDKNYVHVCVCFHACESDPEPVFAGGCDSNEHCAPGAIRERYKIVIRPHKAPPVRSDCSIPDLLLGNRINYPALARWVSRPCACKPDDPCIVLANVRRLPAGGGTIESTGIDITVRPVVYSNDLLFELLLAMQGEGQNSRLGKY
jgi:hypothetical protein